MGIVGRIVGAPGNLYRLFKLYGQHLPLAFDAIFSLPCQVIRIDGRLRGTDEQVTVLYAGRCINFHYLLRTVFDEHRETETVHCTLLTFQRHLDRMSESADVVILDLGWPYNGLFTRKGYLESPDWLNMDIDFPAEWDDVVRNFRRTARRHDLRLIRRNGYRVEVVAGRAAMEQFYDRMYLPFIQRRHAAESVASPRKHVIRRGLQGTLLHILRGDEVVAAGIIYPEDRTMFSLWMGIPEGQLESQPEAAISALYYFGIKYAFDNGYEAFDFTGTRSFLKDGAYQFKRRWGPALDDAYSLGSILIKPARGNRKAVLFCQQNPVVCRTPFGLEGVFVRHARDAADGETFARLEKDFGCGGMYRMTLIEISAKSATKAISTGADGCQYQLIACPLDRFAECYVKRYGP